MTTQEAKKLLPIIQAYAEGKTIQTKIVTDSRAATTKWIDVVNPDFDGCPGCYRVKPEPKSPSRTYILRQATAHHEVSVEMYELLKAFDFKVSGTFVSDTADDNYFDEPFYRDVTVMFTDFGEFLRFIDTVGDIVIYRNPEMDSITIYDTYIE